MARCGMLCLTVPDGLPFFHASRQAAFMNIGNTCFRFRPETLICIRHAGYSTSPHVSWKNRDEKSLNLNSMYRKVFSSVVADATYKNKIFICTCRHICKCENSRNIFKNQGILCRNFGVSTAICKDNKQDDNTAINSDTDDEHIKAALDSVTPSVPPPNFVDIVPGKGPPPEPPVDCCMSGCANCVWIQYAEELKTYYSMDEGSERAKKAIEQIENPGLQMFLKLELGLL